MNPLPDPDADVNAYVDGQLAPRASRRSRRRSPAIRRSRRAWRRSARRTPRCATRSIRGSPSPCPDGWSRPPPAPPEAAPRSPWMAAGAAAAASLVDRAVGWFGRDALSARRHADDLHAPGGARARAVCQRRESSGRDLGGRGAAPRPLAVEAARLPGARARPERARLRAGRRTARRRQRDADGALRLREPGQAAADAAGAQAAVPGTAETAFRYAVEDGVGVYYWIDEDCTYAMSGQPRPRAAARDRPRRVRPARARSRPRRAKLAACAARGRACASDPAIAAQPRPRRRPVDAVDTPALVVDLDAFERNLDLMANAVRGAGLALRPHAQVAQVPGHRERADRARRGRHLLPEGRRGRGVRRGRHPRTCSSPTRSSAPAKLARLAALAQRATDRRAGRRRARASGHLGAAARGGGRARSTCWSRSTSARTAAASRPARRRWRSRRRSRARRRCAFAACTRITAARSTCARRTSAARRSRAAAAIGGETKAAIEAAGIACPVVTGAGTGTWQHERDSGVYTELQPGSYIFMDADYHRNALAPDEHHFEQSLYVLATVMSAPVRERAIVDAGLKAFAFDSGPPQVLRRARTRLRQGVRRARRARRRGRCANRRCPAIACGSSRVTAIRRSISTTGSSACAARASSACGRCRARGARVRPASTLLVPARLSHRSSIPTTSRSRAACAASRRGASRGRR